MDSSAQNDRLLSFIIVNLDTEKLLSGCISSIQETASEFDYEIWLVDNASRDRSVETVKKQFPDVKIIENKRNLGFAKANNLALSAAAGKYFILLNTDAALTTGAIETAVAFMEERKDAAVCGAQLLNADGSRQNSIANIPGLLTELTNKSLLRFLFPSKYPGKEKNFDGPVEVESVVGAFMCVRREAVDSTGFLDEDYFFFLEETDWCLRFRENGWKVYHHPSVRVIHLQGQSAGKDRVKARIEYWRSRYAFFRKHKPLPARAALRTGLFFRLLVDFFVNFVDNLFFLFASEKKRGKLALYAVLLAWHLSGCPSGWGLAKGRQS